MTTSKTQNQILFILRKNHKPTAASFLTQKIKVNKTTVYRSLDNLLKEKMIEDVDFGDGVKRYEVSDSKHHHHLICINCNDVQDVEIKEEFTVPKNFKLVKHNLEFFGYCSTCQ